MEFWITSLQQEQEAIFVCPVCDAENRATARFCRRCGRSRLVLDKEERPAPVQVESARELTCNQCVLPVRVTDNYCSNCGEAQPYRILPDMKVCRDCGSQMPEIANFCYACGTDVANNSGKSVPVPVALFEEEDPESLPSFEA